MKKHVLDPNFVPDYRDDREVAVTALSDAIEGSWPDFLRSAPAEHLAQARQGSVRTASRLLDWLLAHAAERQAVVEYLLSAEQGERT